MNWLINALTKLGLLNEDLDYHLIRASMVLLFLFFGYQQWQDVARVSASAPQTELVLDAAGLKVAR